MLRVKLDIKPQVDAPAMASSAHRHVCRNVALSKLHGRLWLGVHHRYFLTGNGDTGVGGKSELNISTATFHPPSACFFQISTYFPLSVTGTPFGQFTVKT